MEPEEDNAKHEEPEYDLKKRMEPPPSVGIDAMDDEHEECTKYFNQVIKTPSSDNLRQLFTILKSHFDHEEELMVKYDKTDNSRNQPSSFSALNSHKMDHERILQIAQEELDRVNNNNNCGKEGQ